MRKRFGEKGDMFCADTSHTNSICPQGGSGGEGGRGCPEAGGDRRHHSPTQLMTAAVFWSHVTVVSQS